MTTKISYKTRKKKRKILKMKERWESCDLSLSIYLCFRFELHLKFQRERVWREFGKSIGRKWGKWLGMRNKCHFEEIKNGNIVQKEFSLKNNNNKKNHSFNFNNIWSLLIKYLSLINLISFS